jgi:hypothetical protein
MDRRRCTVQRVLVPVCVRSVLAQLVEERCYAAESVGLSTRCVDSRAVARRLGRLVDASLWQAVWGSTCN